MHLFRSLVVPVLAFLLAAGATALDTILEHRLGRCPCHIRITGYASERAPISLQVIKLSVYRHWVRSGRPHEIIRKTSYLKPGPWSSNSRISSHGAWVLLVHSNAAVTAKVINAETANRNNEETVNQRRKEIPKRSAVLCPRPLLFSTRISTIELSTASRQHTDLSMTERILNGVRLGGDRTGAYNVLIRHTGKVCSGSLLSSYWVLTAAHCTLSEGDTIYAGVPMRKNKIAEVVRHPSFERSRKRMVNDIALVRLRMPAPNANAAYVAITTAAPAPSTLARMSGFGTATKSGDFDLVLRAVDLHIDSASKCYSNIRSRDYIAVARNLDARTQLCTAPSSCGRAPCIGDSGGPLCMPARNGGRPLQIGILSFIIGKCGFADAIYTRVGEYADWISKTTGGAAKIVS